MSVQFYPNGIGGTAPGDSLDLAKPLQTTGNIWYVSSLIGTDAASPAGQNREKPLATLAQAVTNAVAGDIVVFLAGHAETLTAQQFFFNRLTLIGEGTTAGKPAVTFTSNSASSRLFNVAASGCEFRNIYFATATQTNSAPRLEFSASDCRIRGCYFDFSGTDTAPGILLAAASDRIRIESTTFVSIATSTSAQPKVAIKLDVVAVDGIEMYGVTVSAGTVGFSNYAAIDLSAAAATRVNIEALSLLLGSDVAMGASATGRVNVQLATGGSRVSWG